MPIVLLQYLFTPHLVICIHLCVPVSFNEFIFILTPYGLENRSFSFEENHLQTANAHNWMCEKKKCSVKSQSGNYLSLLFINML